VRTKTGLHEDKSGNVFGHDIGTAHPGGSNLWWQGQEWCSAIGVEAPMSPQAEPNINPLIWAAIEQKRLLRFRYKNRERIVEPHDYGIHNGLIKLFGYQVGGSSSHKLPNWRWAEQHLIYDIQMLDRTFPGGRPTKSGKHHKWDKLFIRVKPADKNQK
jgi:hypothetical protein